MLLRGGTMDDNDIRTRPSNRDIGAAGEHIAADWLRAHGMLVVDRNWRCRIGEIDIVALEGTEIVVVEVKTRRGRIGGHPFEAITPVKRSRLRQLAAAWLREHPAVSARSIRIDVIGVRLGLDGSASVECIRGLE
jgi:putative endonuclease